MIGRMLGHYRIVEQLGAGGMGVVYRARDERLNRDVALKVLPAGTLADETARSRFRREALTLSKLNHPNIAVVYDFDTEGGVDFLVMEFVAGETLAAKIVAGPLPEKEVIALATQIAEALEEAHEHDIIHRDLKPGNVMVTAKGRVKVLDFGLAKLVKPTEVDAATASLAETQAGAVMGTVPYMAPEQLQGKVVDARADIYALGAVLYEMATGRRPFPEKQSTQLIAAILTETPQPPRELNGQVSAGLEAIILKSLEKNPEQRYASAQAMLEDLRRLSVGGSVQTLSGTASVGQREGKALPYPWVGAAIILVMVVTAILLGLNVGGLRERLLRQVGAIHESPLQIQSLAVLPLANLSGDPAQDYFADGMTEALISEVGQIGALRVISRQSVMRYKGSDKPLPQIAQELKVDALIEGSVLRSGDRIRVTAQLIGAVPERHLWARSYERDLRDVLALQGEVAQAIAHEIQVKLTPQEQTRLASVRPVNPEAHELYLKGSDWLRRDNAKKALEYFQQAIDKDPNFAWGYVGMATAYGSQGEPAKQKANARKALELDDSLADAHVELAYALWFGDWDWSGSEREIKRALEINPNSASALGIYNGYLERVARPEENIAQARRALEINPLVAEPNLRLGWAYCADHRYDEALAQFEKVKLLGENPGSVLAMALGQAYAGKGMYKEAIAQFLQMPDTPGKLGFLGNAYARAGNKAEAQRIAQKLAGRSAKEHVGNYELGLVYAGLGENDKAIQSLEEAYRVHDGRMSDMQMDPLLDPLRSDPRFQDLLRRMNFPP